MTKDLEVLLSHLELDQLDELTFQGTSENPKATRVFGGLVLAQAMHAAIATVDAQRQVHSQHAFFLRPGDPKQAITYAVDAIRDGGSFSTRRVVASQGGEAILNASMSFHRPETGFTHQSEMPSVPNPEDLESREELRARMLNKHGRAPGPPPREAMDIRPVDPVDYLAPEPRAPRQQIWMRSNGPLPALQSTHRVMLAYMSDSYLLSSSLLPHAQKAFAPGMLVASLDHALWIHDNVRCDEWLLYDTDSPWAGAGRGLSRGNIYDRAGRLVASSAQECLIRKSRSSP